MGKTAQPLALTAELVARIAREVPDAGPTPGVTYLTEQDVDIAIRELMAGAPAGDPWLFAYGSLLWKPECDVGECRKAVVRGWHRAFRSRILRFRGTLDRPGLMMSLDRGGECHGMVLRLAGDVKAALRKLLLRELAVKPSPQCVRWLSASTPEGPVRAIGFVVNRASERYVGKLSMDAIADVVATAAGHWGSLAAYLHETIVRLEQAGIRDRNLWRLQELVAERIRRSLGTAADSDAA